MPTIHTSPLTLPWASLAEVPGLSETVRGRRSRLRKQGKQGVPGHKQERERESGQEKKKEVFCSLVIGMVMSLSLLSGMCSRRCSTRSR